MASQPAEPIAIVGSGCRFPGGSNSPSALWQLLKEPRDVVQEIPAERFDTTGFYHRDSSHHGTSNVRHSYLLEQDLRLFDAQFFFISPNEADSIDPQQRLLLETVYEALEAGGHSLEALRGSDTAVYVGTMGVDWNDMVLRDLDSIPTYFATGTNRAIISNRVSYFFDWHGPSMTIDTACSSSLIAVHQGVQALRTGESRVAVACGTQVILGPETFIIESKMKMLSPTGRSRMWDADADGYARGEGVAAIVLKRLSDAIADGDHIQCLIRETGANQDGYSNGLTVPSSLAQAALIRKTYAKAGLDLSDPKDRPQYFEAHGTGTKAGDPKEAGAIFECFANQGRDIHAGATPLYVGSVKTVIGHTEGAAGLAGLLKGVESIQNGLIPPNLLFNRLNPTIEPFYHSLKVPTILTPWPDLPEGVPRRVSVNSFGFGGSNAHAILEQYVGDAIPHGENGADVSLKGSTTLFTPCVFSAASESSLIAQLRVYSEHLKTRHDINLSDLAWTLQYRRSQLAVKTAFSAGTIADLASRIDERLTSIKQNENVGTRSIANGTKSHILGVFTGQGAQWAAMGAHLITASPGLVAKRIQDLEEALNTLPEEDRPKWRLRDEMLAKADTSRIAEAELSQPLCTALQIILVDLLRIAGVTFSAVVGHSSGEIGAAYAAGFLSDRDAVRVAYYRGLYARLAGTNTADTPNSATRASGAMLAVGTSLEDAEDLISLSSFKGRLALAAHNSSASVTLSGDVEAIILAKKVFDEEKKFARLLKVDTAYHSHHMIPCGDPYVAALRACGVTVRRDNANGCTWFSSVVPSAEGVNAGDEIQDIYWRDNMTNAVLFADAVRNAVANDPQISLAIEVGPHPALKGPASQNIADARTPGAAVIPYYGVLNRGKNDVEAFAEALGSIWSQLGPQSIDFESYQNAMSAQPEGINMEPRRPKLVVGLPAYQWNHTRRHWHESRRSHKMRSRKQHIHELLGTLSPESTTRDLRWNNVLKPSEIPWLEGHQLQGQTVFPAAGYVAMAFEAARHLVAGNKAVVEFFELQDLAIPKAIAFDEGDGASVETLVTLSSVVQDGPSTIIAEFSCYSCPSRNTTSATEPSEMDLMATGTVKIVLGSPQTAALLSGPAPDTSNMSDVDVDRFYSSLVELGYGYNGHFRTMSSVKRRLNQSSALVSTFPYDHNEDDVYLVHPSMLDVAFQAAILAYSAPGDGRLWSLHVPTAIGRIRVNPELSAALPLSGTNVPVWSTVTSGNGSREPFRASIDILGDDNTGSSMIQVEDLIIKPFAPATAADDRRLYSYTKWHVAGPDGPAAVEGMRPSDEQVELARICERVSFYYLRNWKAELTDDEWMNGQPHHLALRDYVNHTLDTVAAGHHPCIKRDWSTDTSEYIASLISRHPDIVDLQLISAVGENMVAAIRGETTILEHMLPRNMLDDFYANGIGLAPMNKASAVMIKQITHRYPHARILEIGAGTGGATKSVLSAIGTTMSSYTYTDVSAGFFDKAAEIFGAYRDKMTFKVLDAERSPTSQGFEPHSYDLIIASNVLHATVVLQRTLENTRQLLKPGGWLVLAELTDQGPVRFNEIMGGLPGWWLGVNDGRKYSPTLTPRGWHAVLRKAGFGGVDAVTPELDAHSTWPFSIIAAQAVDDRINQLRRPLLKAPSPASSSMYHDNIVILGTQSLASAQIAEELAEHLSRFSGSVRVLDGLPTEEEAQLLEPMSTFINLVDLDAPIFKGITAARMEALQRVFELARHMLWVTHGAISADNPYHMASVTFRRVMSNEANHIGLHHLDLADLESDKNVSKTIAEHLLRQAALDEWEREAPATTGSKIRRHAFLWSKEPEAFVDKGGRLLIPRLLYHDGQNSRINSTRRQITQQLTETGLKGTAISLRADGPPALIEQDSNSGISKAQGKKIQSALSSLAPLSVAGEGFLFIGIGKEADAADNENKQDLLFLSDTNSRLTAPIASVALPTLAADSDQSVVLIAVASQLLATCIVQTLPHGSTIVLHSASPKQDQLVAYMIQKEAEAKGVQTAFVTTAESVDSQFNWTKLDLRAPRHALKRLLPSAPTHFLDLSTADGERESFVSSNLLPTHARSLHRFDLARLEAQWAGSVQEPQLLTRLQDAVTSAASILTSASVPISTDGLLVPLDKIQLDKQSYLTSIVQWSSLTHNSLETQVRPLDARRLFSREKSYLLIGLTGEIGRSVCEWMVANGAGCVCLASRTPKANQKWLQSFNGTGALVKQYALDLADKASLARVVADMRATCPPIAGVANGAMVLRDSLFSTMSIEQMHAVLAPKIEGSNNLEEIFYDTPLDFFMLLSSSTALIGNPGQSSYVIASGYMNGLVRQRRKRGLAASAVDIGRVAGLGYVETAGDHVMNQLTSFGLMPVSETELHQVFAETIQAGYPSAQGVGEADGMPSFSPVVTTGLRTIRDDEELRGPWFENPLFSHCVIETNSLGNGSDGDQFGKDKKNSLPVKDQLATAATNEQAMDVLRESFAAKLCSILQISSDTFDHNAPLVELGMDSLVAVEARSWFLKELKMDIPVLKLVGGSSVVDICELAFKKLPEDLLSKIGSGSPPIAPSIKPKSMAPPTDSPKASSSRSSIANDSTNGQDTPSHEDTPASTAPQTPWTTPQEYFQKGETAISRSSVTPDTKSEVFIKSEPISFGQSRFWFLQLLVEDPTTFNVALKYHLSGHIRVGDLDRALRVVAARHESLRSSFIEDENEVDQASQKVLARSHVKLEHKRIQSAEEAVHEYNQLRAHRFNLAKGPLLRLVLLTLSPTSHYLLVNAHHIIMDVTSFQVLLSDIEKAYTGLNLGPRPRQYPEFSAAQRQAIEQGQLDHVIKYWQGVFPPNDLPPVLPLLPMALSSSRAAAINYEVHQANTRIEPALITRIKAVASAQRSTPFHFYLAAFKAMLFSFTDIQDLTIGIADANRNDSELLGSVGFFMNLLALRFRRQPDQSFGDAIVEARNTAYGALEHSRLPFDVLLRELSVPRSSSHNPMFQAFFDYRQRDRGGQNWCQCQFDLEDYHPGRTGYDISLDVADIAPEAHIALRVQKSFYDSTAAHLLLETYTHFLDVLSNDASLAQKSIPLFGDEQLARAVQVGRGPNLTVEWPKTLPHRIDLVARENPDDIALKDGLGGKLTYTAMIRRIEAIAEALIQAGVEPASRVLVFQQASIDWVCSMLAIMRIGAVYVPLDLRNPLSRLAALADDCQPSAVLVDDSTTDNAPRLGVPVVLNVSHVTPEPSGDIANVAHPDAPAAVLYTSGSTGTPKGIIVRHSSICNQMEGYTKTYKLGAERVLQQSAFTFDFSIDQMFTGLVNGGMVYIVPWNERGDPASITRIMQDQSITYTKVTPSEYSMWIEHGFDNLQLASSWRFAFAGGEPLTNHVLQQFARLELGQLQLFNSYGPAEISIASHKGSIDYCKIQSEENEPIPCGFSLPNYSTYILDDQLQPLPVGMPGEVVIGGAGVSFGYLTNQELTAKVFVSNPHAPAEYVAHGWTRMHRTGDVGHLQEDGSLVFRWRIAGDTQVKLRGLRIDLCDIEANLVSTSNGVLQAAVVTLRKGDPDYLVAHVVFTNHVEIDNQDSFLQQLLGRLPIPQYMVPVLAVPIDKFPLNNHAKVDRKAILDLALPHRFAVDAHDDTELTHGMIQLRQIWREVLGKDSEKLGLAITPTTSFFTIGGNSLLIVRLQSRIRQVLNKTIRLADLLGANTLAQMTRKIEDTVGVDVLDWEQETSPPLTPGFTSRIKSGRQDGSKTVMVTGATGNLAKHLIPLLVESSLVERIHCIAIRDKSSEGARLLSRTDKIVIHSGDLSAPRLGLGENEFQDLCSKVDVIVHLGALRSFWDNYHTLRPSNVQSIKELVQIAAPNRIPIHFISTSGVLARDSLNPAKAAVASSATLEPPTDGSDGYVASKWAGERVLERSAANSGISPFIYRLLPAPDTEHSDTTKSEVLDEFLRCVDLAGVLPDYTGWKGHIDLIAGKHVAGVLCKSIIASSSSSSASDGRANFSHLESSVTIEVNELKKHLEEHRGQSGLGRLQMLKWMGRIKAVGFAFILASLETTVGAEQGGTRLSSRR